MKTIKIIDLLNKIANYEEVPNKIIYDRVGYNLSGNTYVDGDGDSLKQSLFCDFSNLNDEVEILEEEKKIPEKLLGEPRHIYNENELYIVGKVNEILDYLESKEKGDE